MKVAIVGAGLSGLVTLKECLAEGFEAEVFEAQSHIGGAWKYQEPDPKTGQVHSSMYRGLVTNGCRESFAYSDFPCDPARYPDYLSHQQVLQYLEEYASFFDLARHVRFRTQVQQCSQLEDKTWSVAWEEDGEPKSGNYDAVFACSGHLSTPYMPSFTGEELFGGLIVHSHTYRDPEAFKGKRVAILGIGSSAADIACELVGHAEDIRIVTQRGGWIFPRYVLGKTLESYDNRAAQTLIPSSISQWAQQLLLDFVSGKHPPELAPHHKVLEAAPTVRGDFLEKLRMRRFEVLRTGIDHLTPDGIVTSNGQQVKVDVIICCTGYKLDYPYLPLDSYRPLSAGKDTSDKNKVVNLYELIHPIDYTRLYFIGLPEIPGSLPPVAELQARWCVGILAQRIPQPTPDQLAHGVRLLQADQAKLFVHSARHALASPYLPYCDRLASQLGARPTFMKLVRQLFRSGHPLLWLRLLNAVYNKLPGMAQYRLFGDKNKRELAVATILRTTGKNLGMGEKETLLLQQSKEGGIAKDGSM
ncbi:putative dimethylaniline monooxygenase [Phaeomoniella chlamydospora]|uniref:Putative dimethylaniline monooxygenase n=1 Tax=Phaeomoniella chlamydospora TaxID=158046 RepID=A0A0G2FZP7_PHACM|nr:putative dimethylaniline monooxygenase [Phaeomoniella chlamydospora]